MTGRNETISWIARIDLNAMDDSEKNDQITRFLIEHVLVKESHRTFFQRENAARKVVCVILSPEE